MWWDAHFFWKNPTFASARILLRHRCSRNPLQQCLPCASIVEWHRVHLASRTRCHVSLITAVSHIIGINQSWPRRCSLSVTLKILLGRGPLVWVLLCTLLSLLARAPSTVTLHCDSDYRLQGLGPLLSYTQDIFEPAAGRFPH